MSTTPRVENHRLFRWKCHLLYFVEVLESLIFCFGHLLVTMLSRFKGFWSLSCLYVASPLLRQGDRGSQARFRENSGEKCWKNLWTPERFQKGLWRGLWRIFEGFFQGFWRGQPKDSSKPLHSGQKLNPNIFFSNFSGASGISRQNPGISRQKGLIPWVSRDIPNFLAPTPSRGRPPPHQKISGLKSLGLGSFFVPDWSDSRHAWCCSWETDFLPLLVLTRRGRSTSKNQYWQ